MIPPSHQKLQHNQLWPLRQSAKEATELESEKRSKLFFVCLLLHIFFSFRLVQVRGLYYSIQLYRVFSYLSVSKSVLLSFSMHIITQRNYCWRDFFEFVTPSPLFLCSLSTIRYKFSLDVFLEQWIYVKCQRRE